MTKRLLVVEIVLDAAFLLAAIFLVLFHSSTPAGGFLLGLIASHAARNLAREIKALRRLLQEGKEQLA